MFSFYSETLIPLVSLLDPRRRSKVANILPYERNKNLRLYMRDMFSSRFFVNGTDKRIRHDTFSSELVEYFVDVVWFAIIFVHFEEWTRDFT